jgi:fibronectin type 3 domain-containing protein
MRRIITGIFILCCCYGNVFAEGSGIQLLCRPVRDSILLRWAPASKEIWDLGNQYGYMVERHTLLRQGKLLEKAERILLTATPQKPAPLQAWEPYMDDKYVAAAAQCIFGETEGLPPVSPVAVAKRYQQEQNRFSLALYSADQSVLTARLSGLYFADRTAAADEKYLYTVYIPLPDTLPASDTAFRFTGLSEYQPLPQPLDFSATWGDKKVALSWNIFYLNAVYNSYVVEKSRDGIHYALISDNAMVQLSDATVSPEYAYRTDSLNDNTTTWYYRIRGINAFGETGPASDSVAGHGRIPITHAPEIIKKEVRHNREVYFEWDYPEEMNPYITGFRVYRSPHPAGIKQKVYESKTAAERAFTDASPDITNYYALSVFDSEMEKFSANSTYAELIDSIPPAAPAGLSGKIDSSGKVLLTWIPNEDRDMDGYRVYRSNHPGFEFLLVSPAVIKDAFFMDSIQLHTLTKHVYYRLKAIDLRQNQSAFGAVLELKRPDILPPVSPVIKSIDEQKDALRITWINSTSEDVIRHHIYRKEKNDTLFQLLASIDRQPENLPAYTDKSIAPGVTYIYQITAEDDSGLSSPPSSPVQKKAPGEKNESIVLKSQERAGSVTLSWRIESGKKVRRVAVYRAVGDAPLQITGYSTEDAYVDMDILPEQTLRYRIKALFDDESSSALSNEVTVKM